jgi:Tol biopolymer transport system component
VFRSPNGLVVQDVEGSSKGQTLPGTTEFDYPGAIARDLDTLIFLRSSQQTSFDVLQLSLHDPKRLQPVLNTPAYEGGARLSPDARWLSYISNDSGQNEVYLRPYGGEDRRWQVSTDGGTQAVWNPNGKEIFYRNGNKMMAVEVATSPAVSLSPPRQLFEQRYAFGAGITLPNYDISRDGQRFVMVKDESNAGRLNVIVNWPSELTRQSSDTTK